MARAYITDTCCGATCAYAYDASDEFPCWGEIHAIDEEYDEESGDYWWVHACDGHDSMYDGYRPPPPGFIESHPATPQYEE